MLKNKYKQLMIILSMFAMSSANADIYKIEKEESDLIGKTFKIKKAVGYISGVEVCNNLNKGIAYNTDCFLDERAQYVLTELRNICKTCLTPKLLDQPKRIHYKKNLELTVVDAYNAQPSNRLYRMFNSPISYLLLEDNEKNKVEIMTVLFKNLNDSQDDLNKEEKKLSNFYRLYKENDSFEKTLCFYKYNEIDPKEQFKKVNQFIKDFDLNLEVEKSQGCYGQEGLKIKTNELSDFSEIVTFEYYKMGWGILGSF